MNLTYNYISVISVELVNFQRKFKKFLKCVFKVKGVPNPSRKVIYLRSQGQSRVIALLNDPIREEDSIKIMVDKKGEVIQIPTFKKRNPYTLQFDIPGKKILQAIC